MVPTGATCVPLQQGDSISLGDGGGATVLLPARAYVIRTPGTYRIGEAEVRQVKGETDTAVDPVLGARGSALLSTQPEPLVMPPKMLFAAVKPSVMRAGAKIEVLSPLGETLSATPDLVWTGEKTNEYTVQVLPQSLVRGTTDMSPVTLTGCTLKWASAGWPPLKRGTSYRVSITRRGMLLTDETHVFTVADTALAAGIENRIQSIEKDLPAGVARELTKASLLANPDHAFYAEARLIAAGLLKDDRRNPIYLKLMQRCYAGMGSAQGVIAVERRLSDEDTVIADK